jgi:glucuronosyltransferase
MENLYMDNINFVESREFGGLRLIYHLLTAQAKRTERQLSQPEVHDLIVNHENYKFDLVILEYLYASPMLGFAGLYDCPMIGISAIGVGSPVHDMLGNAVTPAVHSELILPYQHGRMSFFQRLHSFLLFSGTKYVLQPIFEIMGMRQARRFFMNSTASLSDLEDRVEVMFVNTNPILDYARPITPNTIQLGSMHVHPPKPLTGELKEHLDMSHNGVIYMSFGSNVKSKDLTDETKSIFINVFRKLPYEILWKFEDDKLANKSNNIRISKWFPQADLLAHPNVKLFITQGGLMSLEEAIDRETPIIAIPFLLDQYQNALLAQEEGFGRRLDLEDLTEETLSYAISEVMQPKYRKNIKRVKKLIYDQPMTNREKAVWWTEYVIRNKGAKNLKYHGRKVPLYQKVCIDVIAFIVAFVYLLIKFVSILKKISSFRKLKKE